jgi:hypothetical protein
MLRENFDLDKTVAEHLRHNYGTRALSLAKMALDEKDLVLEVRRRHPSQPERPAHDRMRVADDAAAWTSVAAPPL